MCSHSTFAGWLATAAHAGDVPPLRERLVRYARHSPGLSAELLRAIRHDLTERVPARSLAALSGSLRLILKGQLRSYAVRWMRHRRFRPWAWTPPGVTRRSTMERSEALVTLTEPGFSVPRSEHRLGRGNSSTVPGLSCHRPDALSPLLRSTKAP